MLGELAAKAAGQCIYAHVEEQLKTLRPKSLRDLSTRKLKEIINTAFQKAHDSVVASYVHAPSEYSFPVPGFPVQGRVKPQAVFNLSTIEGGVMVYTSPKTGLRLVEFGTTVSLALVEPRAGFVVVAHVGDSDVVVGSVDDSGFVTANDMTKTHSAFSLSERFRIAELLSAGDDEDSVNLRDDGYLEVLQLGGLPSSVALGMTRAVGHKWLEEYGVIPRPDIKCYDISKEDAVLVLATDGVWDAMHPRDCCLFVLQRLLAEGQSVDQVARDLCLSCVFMQEKAVGAADNTSAVIIRLDARSQAGKDRERSVKGGSVFLSLGGRGERSVVSGAGI